MEAQTFCPVTRAENTAASRLERRQSAREAAADLLASEFLAAAMLPALATVSTPGNSRARVPFLEVFTDELGNNAITARIVSILMRSNDGQALMKELADKHADYFADEVDA